MRAASLVLLLALAACGGGPDAEALRKDVTGRLTTALPGGEVVLESFVRRGSQSDTKAPAGETRRILYYTVVLKLEKDFDFGAWDGPGVAGLVSTLGAGPKGISGLTSGGNKAGDQLQAHGTALYRRDGGNWVAVAAGAFRPSAAPAYATSEAQGAAAMLEAINKVLQSAPKDTAPATRAVVEEELTAAYAAIRARTARAVDGYAIAAGPEHGQYLRLAQALVAGRATGRARAMALVTRGGDENLRMLREGKVPLALAQGDAALQAYEGRGAFAKEGAHPALRAIGSLYPEAVHVLVRADSGLGALSDLAGRRVAIGVQGAASRGTAVRVLQAHGLQLKDITPLELPLGDALVALRDKRADAVIQVIGVPADSVRDVLGAVPIRLLPLEPRAVATLVKGKAGYFAHTIPAGAYPTQRDAVPTVATAALLLVGTDLSETEVAGITRLIYQSGRDLARLGSAQGTQISAKNSRQGLTVPQHVAAARALKAMTEKPGK